MGLKAHDVYSCALCISCHAMVDSGKDLKKWEREEMWLRAWRKTMFELFDRGLVDVQAKT
jgi:ferredoxin